MEEYIRFRETNNWEKERWRFYIPLRGNERAIRILADALRRLKPARGCFVGDYIRYDIRMIPTPEDRVDSLCKSGRGGYMAWYNKLEGRLDIRAVKVAARLLDKKWPPVVLAARGDRLYKGGIAKMMRPWKRRPATISWPTARIRAAVLRTPISKWGDKLPQPRRRGQFPALTRLRDAGLKTIGDVAVCTKKELSAFSGVGRETVNLTQWMLQEIGLDLASAHKSVR